jgi:DNA-binding XRE family transcriptional regulator
MTENMHRRLRESRINAGFKSAALAAKDLNVSIPSYAGHENGSRGFSVETAQNYASHFKVDAIWLVFGVEHHPQKVAGVPELVLQEVLKVVLAHPNARIAVPSELSNLIIELCKYISKSGLTGAQGIQNVIDFQMERIKHSEL